MSFATNLPVQQFVRDLSQPRGISDSWSLQNDSVIGVQGAGSYANIRFERDLPIARVLNISPAVISDALNFLSTRRKAHSLLLRGHRL
jgi:hypothetical protein